LKHAEGNWLSNFEGTSGEKTDMRVRNMAWWRSPAMPATALVIGNPQMQDKGWEMHIQSLAGALPIMLGDPRQLNQEELKKYRGYADFLQKMEEKHGIMEFRQDLFGFGEPMEGHWDGFQRINTETQSGGIVGVFRHGAVDKRRRVVVKYLNPEYLYQIKNREGKVLRQMTGAALGKEGFEVQLDGFYEGRIFEISRH
jgi:alpha-galactosidase